MGDNVKKKILLIVLASFMVMGVVSAANIWGTYKGKQIIRLTVDGVPVKVSDAPAVIMDNRTMVPIYLLKEAGISYSWNQENQTVDIKSKSKGTGSSSDISNIKLLIRASEYFSSLESLGDMIKGLNDHLSLVSEGDRIGMDYPLDYKKLNDIINAYNSYVDEIDGLIKDYSIVGIDLSPANNILNLYFEALDYYKLSYEGMESYLLNRTDANFDKYLDNAGQGFDATYEGIIKSMDEKNKLINRALNY